MYVLEVREGKSQESGGEGWRTENRGEANGEEQGAKEKEEMGEVRRRENSTDSGGASFIRLGLEIPEEHTLLISTQLHSIFYGLWDDFWPPLVPPRIKSSSGLSLHCTRCLSVCGLFSSPRCPQGNLKLGRPEAFGF